MKILLVDDDESLGVILTKSLAAYRYVVDTVKDGEMGWTYGSSFEYDLMVLDIMLPKLDGISLCKRFRAEGYTTPILLLTSQDNITAKVSGLDAGADDYVVKPFDVNELSARIRVLLRRRIANPSPLLSWGDLLLNPSTCEFTYNGQSLILSSKEYELLELLLRDSQHVLSTDEILDRLWSSEEFPSEATVRSHIRRVRQKLVLAGAAVDFISTVHGRGYYLKAPQNDQINHVQTQYVAFLNETWLNQKPQILSQLAIFTELITALTLNTLNPELQQQAHHTAHKLIGTLGIFGLATSVSLVSELERLLGAQILEGEAIANLSHALNQEITSINLIQNQTSSTSFLPQPETKIMIVDDDHHWLKALPNLLKPWGFKITTLADPKQFWAVLEAIMPNILVLDINMPEVNGFELCQALRRDPHWQSLPILFLSALSDRETQNQAFTIGADDYMCKPIVGDELANRILNRLQRVKSCSS
jgi:DNA-binding response OmpR family regulator